MVAVDDRERIDAPLDRGISGAELRRARAAGVEVDQAGDDLEVVLDAMMHPAREFGMADQPFGEVGLEETSEARRGGTECIMTGTARGRTDQKIKRTEQDRVT